MKFKEEYKVYKEAQEVAKQFRGKLGITDIELSYKIVNGELTDIICLRFKVAKKIPEKSLNKNELIPTKIAGFTTDVLLDKTEQQSPRIVNPKSMIRPIIGGVQIQSGIFENTQNYCGTMGCYFRLGNNMLGLTNYHVLFGGNSPNIVSSRYIGRLGVYQNYTKENRRIGTITPFYSLGLDYATFLLTAPVDDMQSINGISGLLDSFSRPYNGMRVFKSGAKTGITYGIIDGRSCFDRSEISIHIDRDHHNQGDIISDYVDSGSVWVHRRNNNNRIRPVALHYGRGHNQYWAKGKALSSVLSSIRSKYFHVNSIL